MKKHRGVLVIGEVNGDKQVVPSGLELMRLGNSLGRKLAEPMTCLFIGSEITKSITDLELTFCERIAVIDDPDLDDYHPEKFLNAILNLCRSEGLPRLILAAHSVMGQDLLPRLAVRLQTRVVTDCVDISMDEADGLFLMTKPVCGGNIMTEFKNRRFPALATVRPGTEKQEAGPDRNPAEIVSVVLEEYQTDERVKNLIRVSDNLNGVPLEDARVVIAGGRGIGNAEGFEQLSDLAKVVNGAVGSSRPACDLGWISPSTQIGITGKIVAPDLYIAVGISGMMQHITGMSSSRHVVAINKDANAPIFKYADSGIVGEFQEVLPALTEKLKEL